MRTRSHTSAHTNRSCSVRYSGGVVSSTYFQQSFGLLNPDGTKNTKRSNDVSSNVVSVLQAGAFFGALGSAPISCAFFPISCSSRALRASLLHFAPRSNHLLPSCQWVINYTSIFFVGRPVCHSYRHRRYQRWVVGICGDMLYVHKHSI